MPVGHFDVYDVNNSNKTLQISMGTEGTMIRWSTLVTGFSLQLNFSHAGSPDFRRKWFCSGYNYRRRDICSRKGHTAALSCLPVMYIRRYFSFGFLEHIQALSPASLLIKENAAAFQSQRTSLRVVDGDGVYFETRDLRVKTRTKKTE